MKTKVLYQKSEAFLCYTPGRWCSERAASSGYSGPRTFQHVDCSGGLFGPGPCSLHLGFFTQKYCSTSGIYDILINMWATLTDSDNWKPESCRFEDAPVKSYSHHNLSLIKLSQILTISIYFVSNTALKTKMFICCPRHIPDSQMKTQLCFSLHLSEWCK